MVLDMTDFAPTSLYWLGLYEAVQPPRLQWLFHEDYASAFCLRPTRRSAIPLQDVSRRRGSSPPRIRIRERSAPAARARVSPFQTYTGTPQWQHGNAPFYNYVDAVFLPNVPRDKPYTFRVQKGDVDLGTRPTYELEDDGSQKVNFTEYNAGYGIRDDTPINIYARDPETDTEHLVARWRS